MLEFIAGVAAALIWALAFFIVYKASLERVLKFQQFILIIISACAIFSPTLLVLAINPAQYDFHLGFNPGFSILAYCGLSPIIFIYLRSRLHSKGGCAGGCLNGLQER